MFPVISGTVWPIPGIINELGSHRIIGDILGNPSKFRVVAHPMIIRFSLPKPAFSLQYSIRFVRRIAFHTMHDRAEWTFRISGFTRKEVGITVASGTSDASSIVHVGDAASIGMLQENPTIVMTAFQTLRKYSRFSIYKRLDACNSFVVFIISKKWQVSVCRLTRSRAEAAESSFERVASRYKRFVWRFRSMNARNFGDASNVKFLNSRRVRTTISFLIWSTFHFHRSTF